MTRPYLLLAMLSSAISLMPRQAHAQATDPNTPPASTPRSSSAPQSSHSFDVSDTRILSDPLYLPMKGQVFGMTAYTFDTPSGDNFKAGTSTGSFKASDNLVDQTLAYGVTNDLTIRMSLGYGVNERDSTAAATGDVTTGQSKGFNDPTFSATFRVDKSRSPLILDLTGSYSPDAFASIASGGVGEGSMGRGGRTLASRSPSVARRSPLRSRPRPARPTWGSRSPNCCQTARPRIRCALELQRRPRVADQVYPPRVAQRRRWISTAGNYGVSNIDNGNARTYAPPSTRSLDLALNYQFSPNHSSAPSPTLTTTTRRRRTRSPRPRRIPPSRIAWATSSASD